MTINFEKAKDGNDTCKINNIYLHSAYSPIKEAERFVSSISMPFLPEIIFVIEPGISYCADFLKKRFSEMKNPSKIAAIRFCNSFKNYDSNFDFVINYFDYDSPEIFENDLFIKFGEEKLSYSIFQLWEPAGKIFQKETIEIFNSVKNIINKSHSILRTRSFFEKRWIMNSVRFGVNFERTVSLEKKGSCPVIICASGPSLKNAIRIIREKEENFVIAVSSAINPLIENGIIPDLCISTDGGYWAKTHLKSLNKIINKDTGNNKTEIKQTIFAFASEGNCSTKIVRDSKIFPLTYPDGIESRIFESTGIKSFDALRCGTVSGTALDLAIRLTTGDIYFCGLDLSLSNGFQHTQTNLIETSNSIFDNKLNSSEKRNSVQGFSNQKDSLKIYEDWFRNFNPKGRNIFRVIESPKNTLGKIKDISVLDFGKINFSGQKPVFFENPKIEKKEKINSIKNFIESNSKTEDWLYNCFPIDYLNSMHNCDENQKEDVYKKILEQNETLLEKIEKICRQFTRK